MTRARLGALARHRPWSDAEDDAIRRLHGRLSGRRIAERIDRSTSGVRHRLRVLGLVPEPPAGRPTKRPAPAVAAGIDARAVLAAAWGLGMWRDVFTLALADDDRAARERPATQRRAA